MSAKCAIRDRSGVHKGRTTIALFGPQPEALHKLLVDLKPLAGGQLDTDYYAEAAIERLVDLQISSAMSCTTCGIVFEDRDEQKEHFKTDWHRFNLKLRLKGANTVTEMAFAHMADNISSLSGSDSTDSDSSDEDSTAHKKTFPGMVKASDRSTLDDIDETEAEAAVMASRRSIIHMSVSDCQVMSLYRAVLFGKKEHPATVSEIVNRIEELPSNSMWIVLMMGGGHFAAAVFEDCTVLAHKTFHRYVVRAKCGSAQSLHDKKGGHAQSAGAQIRRHNEAALAQDITELLQSWSSYIERCHRIFIKVSTHNQRYLFSKKEKTTLNRIDARIRSIPFPTGRPTFKEVQRVHAELSSISLTDCQHKTLSSLRQKKAIKVQQSKADKRQADPEVAQVDSDSDSCETELVSDTLTLDTQHLLEQDCFIPSRQQISSECTDKRRQRRADKSSAKGDNRSPASENSRDAIPMQSEFYTACQQGGEEQLRLLVERLQGISTEGDNFSSLISGSVNKSGQSLLHIACENSHTHLISYLLQVGCDPSISDNKKVLPYLCTQNKSVRNEFRIFMGHFPEKFNYNKAQVPGPISAELAAEKDAKKCEKRREMNKKRKEQSKVRKAQHAEQRKEEEEKARYLALTDREKRALAAERRLLNTMEPAGSTQVVLRRCHRCAVDITGKVPFEYSNNTFCSPKCLKDHRLSQR